MDRRQSEASSRLLVLAALAVCVIFLGQSRSPFGDALAGFRKPKRSWSIDDWKHPKVLYTHSGYELKYLPKGNKEEEGLSAKLPRLRLKKVPLRAVAFQGAGARVEGQVDSLPEFPLTTENAGTLKVSFPRAGGGLTLDIEDPPMAWDADEAPRTVQAAYKQQLPGIAEVGVRVRSNGDWGTTVAKDIEDVGRLTGSLNSQMDWSADLERPYPAVRGIEPTVHYGATQDGARLQLKLQKKAQNGVKSTYTVQNVPGKYAPADLLHEAVVAASTAGTRHSLEARAAYDRRLPKLPLRGSLAYSLRAGPGSLEASVDFDRVRLKARGKRAELSAAIGHRRRLEEGAGLLRRPAEVELRVGRLVAAAELREGRPKVRLNVAV